MATGRHNIACYIVLGLTGYQPIQSRTFPNLHQMVCMPVPNQTRNSCHNIKLKIGPQFQHIHRLQKHTRRTLIPVIGSCSALLKLKMSGHRESPRLVAILGQGTMLLECKEEGAEEEEGGFWHFHVDVEL